MLYFCYFYSCFVPQKAKSKLPQKHIRKLILSRQSNPLKQRNEPTYSKILRQSRLVSLLTQTWEHSIFYPREQKWMPYIASVEKEN